eukprot:3915818-Prymnesium_polylepis.1
MMLRPSAQCRRIPRRAHALERPKDGLPERRHADWHEALCAPNAIDGGQDGSHDFRTQLGLARAARGPALT